VIGDGGKIKKRGEGERFAEEGGLRLCPCCSKGGKAALCSTGKTADALKRNSTFLSPLRIEGGGGEKRDESRIASQEGKGNQCSGERTRV